MGIMSITMITSGPALGGSVDLIPIGTRDTTATSGPQHCMRTDIALMDIDSYRAKMDHDFNPRRGAPRQLRTSWMDHALAIVPSSLPRWHRHLLRTPLTHSGLTASMMRTNGVDVCSRRHATLSGEKTLSHKRTNVEFLPLAQRRQSVRAGSKLNTVINVGAQYRSIERGQDCAQAPTKHRPDN